MAQEMYLLYFEEKMTEERTGQSTIFYMHNEAKILLNFEAHSISNNFKFNSNIPKNLTSLCLGWNMKPLCQ